MGRPGPQIASCAPGSGPRARPGASRVENPPGAAIFVGMSPGSLCAAFLAGAAVLLGGPGVRGNAQAGAQPAALQNERGRLFVLLLNGGGSPQDNFASHAAHLAEWAELLERNGVPPERVSVLAADGEDPASDLAVRSPDPEKMWLLEGTGVYHFLAEPLIFESTSFAAGLTAAPATRESLGRWFRDARARLRPGDTLLLFVTDHGQDDPRDPRNNQITLWGRGQGLTVRSLTRHIERLAPGVRVVALMSQCFSGGFAHILEAGQDEVGPTGTACGYFSTTADRPAYGCYAESGSGERIGHAFAMIDALRATGSLSEAHDRALLGDQSPDVPLRSLDVHHATSLEQAAAAAGVSLEKLATGWLAGKGTGPESELALASRIARLFDVDPTLDLQALDRAGVALESDRRRFDKLRELWATGLEDIAGGNFRAFLRAYPQWRPRLERRALRRLPDDRRRELRSALLAALEDFARSSGDYQRLVTLVAKTDEAAQAAYRTEVRQAALLRRRVLLITAAERRRLAAEGAAEIRRRAEALEACHELQLGQPGASGTPPAPVASASGPKAAPLPRRQEDRRRLATLTPAFLGISFEPTPAPLRRRHDLPPGAVTVTRVVPGTPAAAAGLARHDVVIGAGGAVFRHPGEIRVATMLAAPEKPWRIEILRAGRRLSLTATLRPYPHG